MTNRYFDPGSGRAGRVHDLFARIAPRYDLINDLQSLGLHRWWKHRAVKLAEPCAGQRALDVCAGTGDLALALARRGARVTALDFSAPMLGVARTRAEGASVAESIEFVEGDAQALPFPDDTFDVVVVAYGLRNLANWQRGVEEMVRVARPGGRLVVLDFGRPDFAPWRTLYLAYLRLAVPCFGRCLAGDSAAYAYILESLRHYPAQRGVEAKFRELGCREVQLVNLLGGVMSLHRAIKG